MMAPTSTSSHDQPMDPEGLTGRLCTWIHDLKLEDIPTEIQTRAKYLILDGVACGLVGAHLPWSEVAAKAIFEMEPGTSGTAGVIGWEKKITPMSAALLNSSFIQGFELDDWHSDAPLHSNSIILPALFAASAHLASLNPPVHISGQAFLIAYLTGLEVGPRVGNALYGKHMLTRGWHSGAVFGPSAAAAAVSKLLGLSAARIEDALGMACTQACGLMSAQYESDVKRMQHGFAARNGLFAALMARAGYVGIKKVYERPYGGFLSTFSQGSGKVPISLDEELVKGLGITWMTEGVRVKPYAAMAGTHGTIDCIRKLQKEHPEEMKDWQNITGLTYEMSEPAFNHGGWLAQRPLAAIGAQMSNSYVGATQIVDGEVLVAQFRHDKLERDDVWQLVDRTTCVNATDLAQVWTQRVTLVWANGKKLVAEVPAPRGVDPALRNDEIVEKWRALAGSVAEGRRIQELERLLLKLDELADVSAIDKLLETTTRNPIA